VIVDVAEQKSCQRRVRQGIDKVSGLGLGPPNAVTKTTLKTAASNLIAPGPRSIGVSVDLGVISQGVGTLSLYIGAHSPGPEVLTRVFS
jgi:hypothetical protein